MNFRPVLIVLVLASSWSIAEARQARNDQETERITSAAADVVLSVCLNSGSISVKGWDQNQVRVRSSDGMSLTFQRPNASSADAAKELTLVTDKGHSRLERSCIPFADFEIEVPRGATVNFQARHADVNASGFARLKVNTQEGSITIDQITNLVDANTLGGDIAIRNSKGSIKLHSVAGSIDAKDLDRVLAADTCEAGTVSGDITLDRINHLKLKIGSVSGGIVFKGPLVRAGQYNFAAIDGDLNLAIPADSSFHLSATFSEDENISSDFPIRSSPVPLNPDLSKRHAGLLQHVEATFGTGGSTLELSSFSGSIVLRKY